MCVTPLILKYIRHSKKLKTTKKVRDTLEKEEQGKGHQQDLKT